MENLAKALALDMDSVFDFDESGEAAGSEVMTMTMITLRKQGVKQQMLRSN